MQKLREKEEAMWYEINEQDFSYIIRKFIIATLTMLPWNSSDLLLGKQKYNMLYY